jgi:beta-glucosidase
MTSTQTHAAPANLARQLFPQGFVWGVATSAYQIEGAVSDGGRLPSIWDTFSHTHGRVVDATTGDVATDHYNRYGEDVALMAAMGVPAYRFSVAWPRVFPTGSGPVNQDGLDFYSRLVDTLLDQGITPYATLYHWDLPQALEDAGGWPNRDTASHFADYARTVAERLGDRVEMITTLNEPWCSAFLGYANGVHAPGRASSADALASVHHLLLAHGLGVSAIRSVLETSRPVSITLNPAMVRAASESEADLDAMRHVDGISNRIFLDPVLRGEYPTDVLDDLRHLTDWAFIRDGDLELISAPIDVLGVNYYSPALVTAADPSAQGQPTEWVNDPQSASRPSPWPGTDLALAVPQTGPYTAMNWRIEPGSFTELLIRLRRDYPGVPFMITENGAAFDDPVASDGEVHDQDRIDYLNGHLSALHNAMAAGVDIRGYFLWTLFDNFEWAWGLSKRFGIIHVDFATQRRQPKDSARWYSRVIAANGLP